MTIKLSLRLRLLLLNCHVAVWVLRMFGRLKDQERTDLWLILARPVEIHVTPSSGIRKTFPELKLNFLWCI
jgi:hypothetical protein